MSDTRKIIQLLRGDKRTFTPTLALCDDGSIWRLSETGVDHGAYFEVQKREWLPSDIPTTFRTSDQR